MKDIISIIPNLLIWLRLGIALFLLADALDHRASKVFLLGVFIGFLSDLLDGVIARHLKIVTNKLRVFDSYIDIVFYISLIVSICLIYPSQSTQFYRPTLLTIFLQLINWGISLFKFNKLTSYHSYLAKIRALMLFISVVGLVQFHKSFLFWYSITLAIFSNLEGITISLILPKWQCDVWTIFHAIKLRKSLIKSLN